MTLERRGNTALITNPPAGTAVLTTWGSDFLWAMFCIMALSLLIISVLSLRKEPGQRTFYYLNMAILTAATISYFSLASDLGLVPILTEFGSIVPRQVSYVRYIDWFVTTPLLLTELLLTAGCPTNIILATVFADIVMIITGLVGALTATSYKWGYFTFGNVAMFYVFWHILNGFKTARRIDSRVLKAYSVLSFILVGLWIIYPVCWGLAEGANVISVNAEMVFYGVLDVLAKPVFAAVSIVMHEGIDEGWLGLTNEPRMNLIEAEKRFREKRGGEGKDVGRTAL